MDMRTDPQPIVVQGEQAMRQFGRIGGEVARGGLVLCLDGSLGAGKTTLVSGLAVGLGLQAITQSPTFTLIAEYAGGRLPLYHMDLYRLAQEAPREIQLLDEYLYGDGVCAIEWATWIEGWLPDDRIEFAIRKTDDPETRLIKAIGHGNLAMGVLRNWIDRWSF